MKRKEPVRKSEAVPILGDGPRKDIRPMTAREALDKWDEGETVWVIELGGLGPGYEQAIHIAMWEIVRWILDENSPKSSPPTNEELDGFLAPKSRKHRWGLSGAQAGAAKWLALEFVTKGYRQTLDRFAEDRRIMVDRSFPKAPPAPRVKAKV